MSPQSFEQVLASSLRASAPAPTIDRAPANRFVVALQLDQAVVACHAESGVAGVFAVFDGPAVLYRRFKASWLPDVC